MICFTVNDASLLDSSLYRFSTVSAHPRHDELDHVILHNISLGVALFNAIQSQRRQWQTTDGNEAPENQRPLAFAHSY